MSAELKDALEIIAFHRQELHVNGRAMKDSGNPVTAAQYFFAEQRVELIEKQVKELTLDDEAE